jgi:tetratricopeptide (TPR) repeat protein
VPNDLATLWLLGEAYIGVGDFATADSALNRLVEIQPGCEQRATQTRQQGWVVAYNRGVQSFAAGDMTGALEAFESANLIYQDARSYNNVAYIYETRGEIDLAVEAYRSAIAVAEDQAALRAATINMAELLSQAGRSEEALQIYEDYTAEHPDDGLALVNYAVILAQAGDREQSSGIFEDLLSREGQSFDEWNQLGVGLLRVLANEEAIQAFEKARALEPYNMEAMANLVDAYIEAERWSDARSVADTLVKWFPYDAPSYARLAMCLTRVDRAGESLIYLQMQQSLLFEFQAMHLSSTDAGHVLRGQVKGRGRSVGETVTVQFEFLGAGGEVVATQGLQLIVPPEGVVAPIGLEIVSEQPVAGFRYSRVQS